MADKFVFLQVFAMCFVPNDIVSMPGRLNAFSWDKQCYPLKYDGLVVSECYFIDRNHQK